MPARDIHHALVRRVLIKDGWNITHDPMFLRWGRRSAYIDLGAERLLAAEKGTQRIAVEVKSFISPSDSADLENALGQYVLYHKILTRLDPERVLYLAIEEAVLYRVFDEAMRELLLDDQTMRLIVFDLAQEVIREWIP